MIESKFRISVCGIATIAAFVAGCGACTDFAEDGDAWRLGERGVRTGTPRGVYAPGPVGVHSLAQADVVFINRHLDGIGGNVEYAGDVDGDGADDLLVTHDYCCEFESDRPMKGAVLLIYGARHPRSNFIGAPEDTPMFVGERIGDNGGLVPARVGDLNGDGLSEVAIGARRRPNPDNLAKASGSVYVFWGRADRYSGSISLSQADFIVEGESGQGEVGSSLTGADLDGDGLSELIVGAPLLFQENDTLDPELWLFWGSDTLTGRRSVVTADASLIYAPRGAPFGIDVAGALHFGRDASSELVIGTVSSAKGQPDAGEVCVVTGGERWQGPRRADESCRSILRETPAAGYGRLVAPGDVDGDGVDEVVVGDVTGVGLPGRESNQGAVLLAPGQPNGVSASSYATRPILQAPDLLAFPTGISTGDVNGDEFDDLVVTGRYSLGSDADAAGAAYLFYGGLNAFNAPGSVGDADATFDGVVHRNHFGESMPDKVGAVTADGDLNGDGFADIVVGAPGTSTGGRIYVVYGGP